MKQKKAKKTATNKPLTNVQYLHRAGGVCPNCKSKEITGGHMEVDCKSAWQEVKCDDCGATWQDVYELVAYDNLDIPKGAKS